MTVGRAEPGQHDNISWTAPQGSQDPPVPMQQSACRSPAAHPQRYTPVKPGSKTRARAGSQGLAAAADQDRMRPWNLCRSC